MEFGLIFPHEVVRHAPDELRNYALAVEAAGFDYLASADHVLGADISSRPYWTGPYTAANPFHEVIVLFAFLAAIIRLELTTTILVLPQRQTALLAKQVADLDLLLNGRFRLGIGVGWNDVEFEGLSADFSTRGERLEEQVKVLRRLWASQIVSFRGRFHSLEGIGINPLPKQQPIPIWCGGAGYGSLVGEAQRQRLLERIGRIADGWMAENGTPIGEIGRSWDVIQRSAEANGRDPAELGLQVYRGVSSLWDIDALALSCSSWQKLGVTHISIRLTPPEQSLANHLKLIEAIRPMLNQQRTR